MFFPAKPELACIEVFPRPQGVRARSFCDRTGATLILGGTGMGEAHTVHRSCYPIDTVHRAKLGNGTGASAAL